MMAFGFLFMLLFWVALVFGAVWLVRAIFWGGPRRHWANQPEKSRAAP